MARRQLLTEGERRHLFGVPADPDALVRHYTLSRSDLDLVATRRGDANRLGFAVQLALLRHQGLALAQAEGEIGTLVHWMARRIDIPVATFADYARRPQTMTDHARDLAAALGLRPATDADLPFMIEAAARAAWTTDKGLPIAAGIVAALRSERIILPVAAVIERAGAAGRARARQRVAEALLAGLTDEQLRALDELLVIDPKTGFTRLAWVKEIPSLPKAGHIRDLLDKLHFVRGLGIDPDTAARIPESRFQQFAREGSTSFAHRIDRYAPHRRRATLVALLIDQQSRLADAALDMADRLIGNAFTRAKHAKEKTVVASTKDVSRLMRLFQSTIEALNLAQENDRDAFAVVDETVGWAKLLRVRGEVADLADLADEDPLVREVDPGNETGGDARVLLL